MFIIANIDLSENAVYCVAYAKTKIDRLPTRT